MGEEGSMKMILAIVRDVDDERVTSQLVAQGYRVTRMASTGGFLRRGNVTLLIGVEGEEQVQKVIDLLRETCSPTDSQQKYRATLFVVNAEHFEQV
jgi:uncharacterized protein YaaQ